MGCSARSSPQSHGWKAIGKQATKGGKGLGFLVFTHVGTVSVVAMAMKWSASALVALGHAEAVGGLWHGVVVLCQPWTLQLDGQGRQQLGNDHELDEYEGAWVVWLTEGFLGSRRVVQAGARLCRRRGRRP
jgi:type IV secretory pathway TrbF-like protein